MKYVLKNSLLVKLLSSFALLFLLVACGGGSSGTADGGDTGGESGATGFFTLVAGDDDISDFDQALFAISQVQLLGDDDQDSIVLLDEPRQIDFLALETVNEVLAETEVPVGSYNKIRFTVDTITLVRLDADGEIEEEVDVRVLANGKVDVLAKGGFDVNENESLIVAIDVDLEKSIKLIQTGNGRYQFRPVIFASIVTSEQPGGLIRIAGEFEAVFIDDIRVDDRFKLCAADLMSDDDDVADSPMCRVVFVDEDTGVFVQQDATLTPASIDTLNNGEQVVIYGRFSSEAASDDGEDDTQEEEMYGVAFNAFVVASGAFQQLEGVAQSSFDNGSETFELLLDEGQGVVGDLNLVTRLPLADGAKLFTVDGEPASSDTITIDTAAEVEGLLVLDIPNSIEAFIAIIEPAQPEVIINGEVTGIDFAELSLIVRDADDNEYCIVVTPDTEILQLQSMGDVVEVVSVDLDTLSDAEVEVTGVEDEESGCITASAIILSTLDV